MTLHELKRSLSGAAPPPGLPATVAALWWAAKDDWSQAHELVMDESGADAAWVHAYLHRVEGDLPNAGYWYRQAGRKAATGVLETEWDDIATALLRAASGNTIPQTKS
jgi:hypothetical protein